MNNKDNSVKELREALFNCLIQQLTQDPTSAWARVARDVLADYDKAEDAYDVQTKATLQKLQDAAPFKLGG